MKTHVLFAEDAPDFAGRPPKQMMEMMIRSGYYRFSQSVKWNPSLNVYEDEDSFYICAELPGLHKEQINVEVSENSIRIWGERAVPPLPQSQGPTCVLRMEIDSGPFERLIELPSLTDMNSVEARLIDGFLWITVKKDKSSNP